MSFFKEVWHEYSGFEVHVELKMICKKHIKSWRDMFITSLHSTALVGF